jgi:hypothetical protein
VCGNVICGDEQFVQSPDRSEDYSGIGLKENGWDGMTGFVWLRIGIYGGLL